jgi:metallo-beta-lactamase class B
VGQDAARAPAAVKFTFVHLLLYCFVLSLVSVAFGQSAQRCAKCGEWNRPQKPFRIFGNSYYVGTHGLSSILITSERGHVLIDGALPQSAAQIANNLRALGFHIEDVKVILNSHVHFDHAGGIAELQRLSHARVVASDWSANVLRSGRPGTGDPQYIRGVSIAPVANVGRLHDGEAIRVGEISIRAHITPGHTPGGTSFTWKTCEGPICRNMVYADSTTPVSSGAFRFTSSRDYPGAQADFEKSFAFMETTPCDILITTHPEASLLWERLEARGKGTFPDPMVNSRACRELAEHGREQLRERFAEERRKQSQKAN